MRDATQPPPTPAEANAQEELREVTLKLASLLHWLREIAVNLPGPPVGTLGKDDNPKEDPDVATEVRATIQCVLRDDLEPALRDLDDASRYRPVRRRERTEKSEA
jgi:hypothetical protein